MDGSSRQTDAMIPRNWLLRVVAPPAFEGLPALLMFVSKYRERW
jgi:hypothetical protein